MSPELSSGWDPRHYADRIQDIVHCYSPECEFACKDDAMVELQEDSRDSYGVEAPDSI